MAAPYIGNQDYRGYLNYLGSQGNGLAKQLLNYVGNDAIFGGNANPIQKSTLDPVNKALYAQYQVLSAPAAAPSNPTKLPSIYGGGGGSSSPAPVYAPKLDVAALSAQARAAAEGAVNPFYTKQLNDFLAQQAAKKQQQQTLFDTNIKNYEDQLKNTLETNDLSKTRTTEDVAKNLADVNQAADEFQTDTGQAFDTNRLELARQASTGGLGAQKLEAATTDRNVQESRQVQKFQDTKNQQELFKSRTFEDLARSGDLATQSTEKGKKAAQFDLDTYIQDAAFEEQNTRNSLEQERLQRVAQEQTNQSKLLFNNYLAGISNPAQYAAAVQTYGGSF